MTVHGRKSGKAYTIPVTLVENDEGRWVVSPYGEVNWVKNARAKGQIYLSRRGYSETLTIEEIPLEERAPILKTYFDRENFARQYTDFTPDTPLETYAASAVIIKSLSCTQAKVEFNWLPDHIQRASIEHPS